LTFPDLSPEDFLPWVNADDARRKGLETVTVRPRKSDVEVRLVALAWDPR
jgi:hypothetical protein